MIVLDTSFLIDFFKEKNMPLDIINSDVATTVITTLDVLSL
jgi:predicted nucleic acid-binding protein